MKSNAIIHLNVPKETKTRWVRDSQQAGRSLTEWVIEKIDGTPRAPVIDLRDVPGVQRWYATVYDEGLGLGPSVNVQETCPNWTNDYHVVLTEDWYPGSVEDWKASIADKVLDYLKTKGAEKSS